MPWLRPDLVAAAPLTSRPAWQFRALADKARADRLEREAAYQRALDARLLLMIAEAYDIEVRALRDQERESFRRELEAARQERDEPVEFWCGARRRGYRHPPLDPSRHQRWASRWAS